MEIIIAATLVIVGVVIYKHLSVSKTAESKKMTETKIAQSKRDHDHMNHL